MADEPQVPAENEPVAEESNVPAPPADEPTTSEPSQEEGKAEPEQVDAPAPDEQKDEPERKPSRAERKIREQHRTIKDLQAELGKKDQTPAFQAPSQPFDINSYVDDQGNLDINAVNQAVNTHSVQQANAIAQLQVRQGIDQYKAEANLESDVKSVPREFPELDDKGGDFNPDLLASVEEEYKSRAFRQVGVDANGNPIQVLDPGVRLADIAARQVKAARTAATRQSENVTASVAKQADEASPRPGPQPPRAEKEFKDLSLEEMEAKLPKVER